MVSPDEARVSLVIVNWNNAGDTIACLDSVVRGQTRPWRIYVVDNASTDTSAAQIRAAHPDVELLMAPSNLGYAGAFNYALPHVRTGGASHVCLLNNDIAVDPAAIDALLEAERRVGLGLFSPKILLADRPDELWYAGGYLTRSCRSHHIGQGELDRGQYDQLRRLQWATGCALFCSLAVAERIGPMDERYFLYLEDVDWCLRARAAGVPIYFVPAAHIFHGVSHSVGKLRPGNLAYYAWRNYYLLVTQRGSWWQRLYAWIDVLSRVAKTGIRQVVLPATTRESAYAGRTRGLLDFLQGRFGAAPVLDDRVGSGRPQVAV